MARPKQHEIRDRQLNLNLKLTAREHEMVQRYAAARNMRPVDYGRAQLFGESHAAAARAGSSGPYLDPLFQASLSRLGNNLNQIARQLNALRYPAPPTLEPLLLEIRALINRGCSGGS
jgi:hypothetical protein